MLALLKYITLIPALIQLIRQLVEMVEERHNGFGGPAKKDAVLSALTGAWGAVAATFAIKAPIEIVLTLASPLIDVVVGVYNAIGYFTRGTAGVTPGASSPATPVTPAPADAGSGS